MAIRMHLTSSGEPVVLGPASEIIVGALAPNGQQIAWVGRTFPLEGTLVAYGHFLARRTIVNGAGATVQVSTYCRVCQGPHRRHASKGVPSPLPVLAPAKPAKQGKGKRRAA
jgi:hypothetical protein